MNKTQKTKDESIQLVKRMCQEHIQSIPLSPLSVNTNNMCIITMPLLEFHNFDTLPIKMKLNNNGRTVTLCGLWSNDQWPFITGSNLNEKYCFSHLHFHWTDEHGDSYNNEHIINGQGHALEMHLIFFKRSCQTIFEAESLQNGCLTLAYCFNIILNQHDGINNITTHLNSVRTCSQTVNIPVFSLNCLLDIQPREYFTYLGKEKKLRGNFSISQWIVFTKAGGVSNEQVKEFRCIMNKRGNLIKRNCRTATVAPDGTSAAYLVTFSDDATLSFDGHNQIKNENIWTKKKTKTALLQGNSMCSMCKSPITNDPKAIQSNVTLTETMVMATKMTDKTERKYLNIKPTRTLMLRSKFNTEKIKEFSRSSTTVFWKFDQNVSTQDTKNKIEKTDTQNANCIKRKPWK